MTDMIGSVFTLLYQDQDMVVIDKLTAMDFHDHHGARGLFHLVEAALGCKLYPVHRLDAATTGLMIFACNTQSAARLGALFFEGKIGKHYLAISHKRPKKKQGWVIGDMQKSRNGNYKLLPSRQNPAKTHFVSQSFYIDEPPPWRLFLLRAYTGKTHQLRVALKAMGAPITGDTRYGGKTAERLYLHAYTLDFELNGTRHHFCQPPTAGALFLAPPVGALLATWQRENVR